MEIILNKSITVTTPWSVIELFDPYASSVERVKDMYLTEDKDDWFVELNFVEIQNKEFKEYNDIINNCIKDIRNSLKDKGYSESYGGVCPKMSGNLTSDYFDGVYPQLVYGNLNKINVCEDIFPSLQSLCLDRLEQNHKYVDDSNNISEEM